MSAAQRAVILWWMWLCFAIALFLTPLYATAEPVYQATAPDGVRVTLHDDKCALPEITNLPRRATWIEQGKAFEGCWGARPDQGIVLAYFADKTVVSIPVQAFSRVTGT